MAGRSRLVLTLAVVTALAAGLGELGMLQRWRLREWVRQLLH